MTNRPADQPEQNGRSEKVVPTSGMERLRTILVPLVTALAERNAGGNIRPRSVLQQKLFQLGHASTLEQLCKAVRHNTSNGLQFARPMGRGR